MLSIHSNLLIMTDGTESAEDELLQVKVKLGKLEIQPRVTYGSLGSNPNPLPRNPMSRFTLEISPIR